MQKKSEGYFLKALVDAKIKELQESFTQKGFEREAEIEIANGFDLAMKKEGHVIVFEIKLGPLTKEKLARVKPLRDLCRTQGFEFRLVVINPPANREITIDWLNAALVSFFSNKALPELEDFDRTFIIERANASVDALTVTDTHATASVSGSWEFEFFWGPDRKGGSFPVNLPFEGEIKLDLAGKKILEGQVNVDVSEYQERIAS